MSNSEIDNAIQMLESDLENSIETLLSAGEPALLRLLQVMTGKVEIPILTNLIDAIEHRQAALGRLASEWPDTVINSIRDEGMRINLYIALGLGASSDRRLKQMAKETLTSGEF